LFFTETQGKGKESDKHKETVVVSECRQELCANQFEARQNKACTGQETALDTRTAERQTVSIIQGVTYAKGYTIIGDPKTPEGKRKMIILQGLLETLERFQSELNAPEAYVLPSPDDPIPRSLSKLTGGFRSV